MSAPAAKELREKAEKLVLDILARGRLQQQEIEGKLTVRDMGINIRKQFFVNEIITLLHAAQQQAPKIDGNTSDGYHIFNELYEFRMLYNAALFEFWAKINAYGGFDVHKSKRHSDGELCFGGGWFVVVAQLPTGQISNHYEMKDWDLFDVPEREKAATWDGHTPADVADRLRRFLTAKSPESERRNGR